MFSVGKIAGGIVGEITGNEDLGKLVGIGVDLYMGNYAGAADQLRGLDFGGGNVFAPEPGYDAYDYDADDYCKCYEDDYTAREYLADKRVTDEMYVEARESGDWSKVVDAEYSTEQYESDLIADARETGDWSGVVEYETSHEDFAMFDEDGNVIEDSSDVKTDEEWEADLQATLSDTEDLLEESAELDDGVEELADFESEEQSANDTVRVSQRV